MNPFSRRTLLRGSAAAAGGAMLTAALPTAGRTLWYAPLFGADVAGAAEPGGTPSNRPVSTGRVVVIFLRGGMDGLSSVVPLLDEAAYRAARPTIAVGAAEAMTLDTRFGLHPGLGALHPLFQAKELAIIHAVGNGTESRSHFAAQAQMELGGVSGAGASGWLARHLAATRSPHDAAVRAVALSTLLPVSLRGCPECVATPAIAGFGLGGGAAVLHGRDAVLRTLYDASGPAGEEGGRALDAVAQLASLAAERPAASAGTGGGPNAGVSLADQLADAARLFGAGLGIEAITVDAGGWDLHNDLGTAGSGAMRNLLDGLGSALAQFWTSLDAAGAAADTTVVVHSEFGRRVAENGSGGVDHGSANALLVAGRGLAGGGRVLGEWPGLAADDLDRGDLRGTTDYRSILAELATKRLGCPDAGALFPGFAAEPVGVA